MPKEYNISSSFSDADRQAIEKAVKKSDLPEGVNVVAPKDIDSAQKPFVVIAAAPYASDARKAFNAGAIDFVTLVYDADKLAKELSANVK